MKEVRSQTISYMNGTKYGENIPLGEEVAPAPHLPYNQAHKPVRQQDTARALCPCSLYVYSNGRYSI